MQGKLIPIPSYIKDPLYRYKMPPLQLKIEGKGNGIKTNIINLKDVAFCLECQATYPLKFLGYDLGSQTTFIEEKGEFTYIINGAWSNDVL